MERELKIYLYPLQVINKIKRTYIPNQNKIKPGTQVDLDDLPPQGPNYTRGVDPQNPLYPFKIHYI